MAFYFKGNKIVFKKLGCVEGDKMQTKDGNYVFFQSDAVKLASLIGYNDLFVSIASSFVKFMDEIGGLMLDDYTAKAEQDGTSSLTLPVAKDPRFILEGQKEVESEEQSENETVEEEENNE
jgi:hypothetical protein